MPSRHNGARSAQLAFTSPKTSTSSQPKVATHDTLSNQVPPKELQIPLDLLLRPAAPAPSERFLPRDQSDDKYVYPVNAEGTTELLSGAIAALPGQECLEGVDLSDPAQAEKEIQKAWVGGYISGRDWGLESFPALLGAHLNGESDELISELAHYKYGEDARQPALLYWLCEVALMMKTMRRSPEAA